MPKPLRLAILRNAVSGQSQRVGYLFTPTPQHVAAVVSAVAQLSGKCSEQKETFGADRVGRTKQWAEGMHPAAGIWLASCRLHHVVIYRGHLSHSTVHTWWN